MEIWRDIEGYEGLYQVSNEGRVKSLERNYISGNHAVQHQEEMLLTPCANSDNYLIVGLSKNGVWVGFKVHKLVAESFIPNPNGYDVVHHKDHNKENNTVENLEWMNKEDHDAIHAVEKSRNVYQYTLEGEFVKKWTSTMECGRNGFNHAHISQCCNGKRKTHKGYKWSYKPL